MLDIDKDDLRDIEQKSAHMNEAKIAEELNRGMEQCVSDFDRRLCIHDS